MERGNGTLMGLMQRGATWYYRRTVVPALRPFFNGRAQIWISLRTTSREDAKLKALKVGFEVERQLQEARKRVSNGQGVTPESVSREWQRRALAFDADMRQTAAPSEESLDAEIAALGDAIADHHESLSKRDTRIVGTLLDEVLAEQGLTVPPQDRQTFALSLLRSRLEALEVALGRATSRAKGEPMATLVDETLTVEELVDAWVKDRQPHPKTETEWRAAARRFEAVNGKGLRVRQVTKGHVRAFKASLLALPSKLSQGGRLSPRTVRKALGAVSTVFKWGVGQGYLDQSPFTGLISVAQERGAGREDRRRLPYSIQDLTTIFGHPTFAAPVLHPTPAPRRFLVPEGVPAARYWLPVLARARARVLGLGPLGLGAGLHAHAHLAKRRIERRNAAPGRAERIASRHPARAHAHPE